MTWHPSHPVVDDQCQACMLLVHETGIEDPCLLAPDPPARAFVGIDQLPNGCWMACLASLTGIPLLAFPAVPDEVAGKEPALHNAVNDLLRGHGWQLHRLWNWPEAVPQGWAIAGGPSPRGIAHAVVVYDGVLVWDPHPSRAGLAVIEDYEVLIPVRRGNALPRREGNRGRYGERG